MEATDIRQPGYYAVIPANVRYDKRLTANAKLLYGELTALAQAEGFCFASNEYFAELYDLSVDRISRLLGTLEKTGYITREVLRDPETNAVTGRKIWIIPPTGQEDTPPGKNNGTSRQKYRDPPGKNDGDNNINNNNIPPISPTGEEEPGGKKPEPDTVLFESFWKAFPPRNGRRNGKADARKAWKKLKVSARLYDDIMAGLDAYIRSDEVARGYAMDASRWLRNRRWEDEIVADPPAVTGSLLPDESLEDYIW